MNADDLIASKTRKAPTLSPELRRELSKLLRHNDACNNRAQLIGRNGAIELLAAHGVSVGAAGLDRIAQEMFGRKSWAQK